jgi:hypothetical protein
MTIYIGIHTRIISTISKDILEAWHLKVTKW